MEIVLSSSVWEATRPWPFGKDDLSYIKVDECTSLTILPKGV